MKRALLLSLSLLPACGSDFEPRSGTWNFHPGETIDAGCGTITEMLSGDFALVANGDGTFTIDPEDATGTFDCNLSDEAFECPEHLLQATVNGADVTLDVTMSEAGSFSSETAASGRRDARVTCTGTQCSAVATLAMVTFPCTAALDFTVSLAE